MAKYNLLVPMFNPMADLNSPIKIAWICIYRSNNIDDFLKETADILLQQYPIRMSLIGVTQQEEAMFNKARSKMEKEVEFVLKNNLTVEIARNDNKHGSIQDS